eukprot:bmy_08941T0
MAASARVPDTQTSGRLGASVPAFGSPLGTGSRRGLLPPPRAPSAWAPRDQPRFAAASSSPGGPPVVLEQLLGARPEGAEGWTVPSQARGPQCGHPASPRATRPALTTVLCPVQVPDEHFSTLLAYLEGLRGRARELTVQKAEVLMRELDEAGAGADAPLPGRTQRVRQVLQLLS